MTIELSHWAIDILGRAQQAAARFDPDARVRLERTASGVQAVLTDEPGTQDTKVQAGEMTLYVEPGLEGLIDIEEPHDRIVLKPLGSPHNPRGDH